MAPLTSKMYHINATNIQSTLLFHRKAYVSAMQHQKILGSIVLDLLASLIPAFSMISRSASRKSQFSLFGLLRRVPTKPSRSRIFTMRRKLCARKNFPSATALKMYNRWYLGLILDISITLTMIKEWKRQLI